MRFGGLFLETQSDSSQSQNNSTNPSISYYQNHLFLSEHQQVMQRVNAHLDEVIPVMNQLNQARNNTLFRNPAYKGAATELPWLPGYMFKIGIERVEGGIKLKKCIDEEKLDLIIVPEQQYIYHIPETHHHLTELRSICVAKKIEGSQSIHIKMSVEITKQLITLILKTGISDWKWRNLVHCDDGKLAIIDTAEFCDPYYSLLNLLEQTTFEEGGRSLVIQEINIIGKSRGSLFEYK